LHQQYRCYTVAKGDISEGWRFSKIRQDITSILSHVRWRAGAGRTKQQEEEEQKNMVLKTGVTNIDGGKLAS
jgi:hypothetical protein